MMFYMGPPVGGGNNSSESQEQQTGIQDQRFDISGVIKDVTDLKTLIKNPGVFATNIFKNVGEQFSPKTYIDATKSLNEEAFRLARSLGVSSQRTRELTVAVADAIPEFVALGFDVKDAGVTMSTLFDALDTNFTIASETLTNFAATAKVTGVEQKTLAVNFRDVGVGIASIGDKMLEVTKIARQAGVTVKAVSDGVVGNLDKMNIYNFEGGIKGLAKMAAQASRLGFSMDGIFGNVEKVFNPEGAIGFAAALQRLGVTTSDLLDPLRLMDLAQNDPTELQNQIVNMTKEFVRFNKEANQFEILPGAKRRLNEIGKELGYNNGELQKMALNAANFDYKLKQIRMPDLPINEDTRNLIATMAQINKSGVAEIRVAEVDKQGKLTGEYITKAVSELTAKDIELVEKQQISNAQSMEEIAHDQLDELRKLNSNLNQFIMAQRYGTASSNLFSGTYTRALQSISQGFDKTPFGTEQAGTSRTYRDNLSSYNSIFDFLKDSGEKIFEKVKDIVVGGSSLTMTQATQGVVEAVKEAGKLIKNVGGDVVTGYKDLFADAKIEKTINYNGNHTYTIKVETDLGPEMTQVAQTVFSDAIKKVTTSTEFQEDMKRGKENVFDKPIEPQKIKISDSGTGYG
jgi:hypothetical protein